MAKIRKEGARKPIILDGGCYTSDSTEWAPADDAGFVRAVGMNYALTITTQSAKERDYTVELSEDQMLETVAAWMKRFSDNRRSVAKRAQKPATA